MTESRAKTTRRALNAALVVVFLVVLFLPWVDSLLHFDPMPAPEEKRTPAPRPAWTWAADSIRAYPKAFDEFYKDHFGLRNLLLYVHKMAKFKIFGLSPTSRVVVADDGWLFFSGDCAREYQQSRPFTWEELVHYQRFLESRRDWLAERGIRFLFTIAPNKHTIYKERVPPAIAQVGPESLMDQLFDHLSAYSDIEVLDLRPALLEAKQEMRIYHKTDAHWNELGGLVFCNELVTRLGEWFPDMTPNPLESYDIFEETGPGGGVAMFMDLKDQFSETEWRLRPKRGFRAKGPKFLTQYPTYARENMQPQLWTNPRKTLRAVMIRDSFGGRMMHLLAEHFGRIVFWPRHNFKPAFFLEEKPDVVIMEMAERYLKEALPFDPFCVRAEGHRNIRVNSLAPRDYAGAAREWNAEQLGASTGDWRFSTPELVKESRAIGFELPQSCAAMNLNTPFEAAGVDAVEVCGWLTPPASDAPIDPIFGMNLYWARAEDVEKAGQEWPFREERSVPFERWDASAPHRWVAHTEGHPLWDGAVERLYVYVVLPDADPFALNEVAPKRLWLKSIRFLRE